MCVCVILVVQGEFVDSLIWFWLKTYLQDNFGIVCLYSNECKIARFCVRAQTTYRELSFPFFLWGFDTWYKDISY